MTEHLNDKQIQAYRDRTLSPEERLRVSDHLAGCDSCLDRIRSGKSLPSAAYAAAYDLHAAYDSEEVHLSYEEMAAYVDGTIDAVEREIVEGHIETCASCATALRELRSFRTILSTYPVTVYAPPVPPTWLERLGAFFKLPTGRFLLQTALPAGAAALLVAAMLHSSRPNGVRGPSGGNKPTGQETAALQQQLAQERSKNAQLLAANRRNLQVTQATRDRIAALTAENSRQLTRLRVLTLEARGNSTPVAQNLVRGKTGRLLLQVAVRPQDQALVTGAFTQHTLSIPKGMLAGLETKPVVTMSASGDKIKPVDGLRPASTLIASDHPTFQWHPVPGAQRYLLHLVDSRRESIANVDLTESNGQWTVAATLADSHRQLPAQTSVDGTRWAVPEGITLLKFGETYSWNVQAFAHPKGDTRAPEADQDDTRSMLAESLARFTVVTPAVRQEVLRTRSDYASSPVLLGIFYTSRGLLDDARAAFHAALELNPDDRQAQRFLRQLSHP